MYQVAKRDGEIVDFNLSKISIAIEKAFQPGGKNLRDSGIRIESLAKIESVSDGKINFAD